MKIRQKRIILKIRNFTSIGLALIMLTTSFMLRILANNNGIMKNLAIANNVAEVNIENHEKNELDNKNETIESERVNNNITNKENKQEEFNIELRWVDLSNEEYKWNAEESEDRVIKLGFYYKNEITIKDFNTEEIKVTIPGIGKLNRGSILKASDITADEYGTIEPEKDWSYKYDDLTDTYTFYNNNKIKKGESFNGSLELIWKFTSRECVNGYSQNLQAILDDGINLKVSQELNLHFTSKRDTYKIQKSANLISSSDELRKFVEQGNSIKNYVWIQYTYKYHTDKLNSRGLRNRYLLDTFPEGSVIASDLGVTKNNDGSISYKFMEDSVSDASYMSYSIIVGYPKKYIGETIKSEATIYGIYKDEINETNLANSEVEVKLEEITEEQEELEMYYVRAEIEDFSVDREMKNLETMQRHSIEVNNRNEKEINKIEINGVNEEYELKTLIETLKFTHDNLSFKYVLSDDTNLEDYLKERANISKNNNEIKVVFDFSDNPIVSKNFNIGYVVQSYLNYDDYYNEIDSVYTVSTFGIIEDENIMPQYVSSYNGKTMSYNSASTNILLVLDFYQQQINLEKKEYNLEISKVDAENKTKLQGVQFAIYDDRGNKIRTNLTGILGNTIVKNLKEGIYKIKEEITPFGYIKEDDFTLLIENGKFTLKQGEYILINEQDAVSEDTILKIDLIIECKRDSGSILVYKIDEYLNSEKKEVPLDGVEFELQDTYGNIIDTITTDEFGCAIFENVPWGKTYVIKEKNSIYGYEQATENTYLSRLNKDKVVTIESIRKKGLINLTTVDEKDGTRLSGIKYGLYAESPIYNKYGEIVFEKDALIEDRTTDENGTTTFNELIWGEYYIKEIKNLINYNNTNKKISFAINSKNVEFNQDLKIYNTLQSAEIKINKTIKADSIIKGHGNSSFIFKIVGKDKKNVIKLTLYRIIDFSDIDKQEGEEYITKSITISGLEKYSYEVSEEKTFRYEVSSITKITDNVEIKNETALIDLTEDNVKGEVTFINKKINNSLLTDSKLLINKII